jgi:hypothetical protein
MAKTSHRVGPVLLLTLVIGGCLSFQGVGPEEAPEVNPPRTVRVTIEYRQPGPCGTQEVQCTGPVVFFGNWMRPGSEFPLTPDPTNHVYRGVALDVPANYPPHFGDDAYQVHVYDANLPGGTGGMTALRLKVGGESLNTFNLLGTAGEHGLVYIDEHGAGHNPL